MPELVITKRRKDGTQAKIAYRLIPHGEWSATEEEKGEMLVEAEMNGNSSGEVRVHFNGF